MLLLLRVDIEQFTDVQCHHVCNLPDLLRTYPHNDNRKHNQVAFSKHVCCCKLVVCKCIFCIHKKEIHITMCIVLQFVSVFDLFSFRHSKSSIVSLSVNYQRKVNHINTHPIKHMRMSKITSGPVEVKADRSRI